MYKYEEDTDDIEQIVSKVKICWIMEFNPMVTIIVPVYNSEQYLPICVESILKQTFKDFELLLVDDGSTDRSGDLCETYA